MMMESIQAAALRKKNLISDKLREKGDKLLHNIPWLMLGWGFAGFFMARASILGSLYPFAPAFMGAAAAYYGKRSLIFLLPILTGLYTAVSGGIFLAYALCSIALTLIFLFYPMDIGKKLYMVPIMVVAMTAVGKGIAVSLSGGTSYDLLISGFESILSAALSLILLLLFRAGGNFVITRRLSSDEVACCFVLLIGLLGGMSDMNSGFLQYRQLLSCFIILTVAYIGGAGAGAAMGALIGIVPSLSQVTPPLLIASYAFSGLLAGVFNSFGRVGSVMGFLFGALLMAFYMPDALMIREALTSGIIAALIFFMLPKVFYSKLSMAFNIQSVKTASEARSEKLLKLSARRLRNVGLIFRDLGQALSMSNEEEQGNEENFKMIMTSLDRQLCHNCSLHNICWKVDQLSSYRGVLAMFKAVEKKGKADAKDIPDNFSRRCPHLKELVILVNCLYELYSRGNFWLNQRKGTRRLVESQLQAVSDILDDVAHEVADHDADIELLQNELAMGLQAAGMPIEAAGIDTLTDKYIEVWVNYTVCPGEKRCRAAIAAELERVLGRGYGINEIICGCGSKGKRCTYRILADSASQVQIGKAQCAKDKKGICGDSSEAVLLDSGKEILMLSDGMGIGKKAQSQSAYALELVSRFLEAGFRHDTAIELVNAAMTLKGREESFVTLDICLLDLYSHDAEFVKMGGAPSFVKRGKEVRLIRGSGLPIGMLANVEKDIIKEHLQPDDMIVMASDGLLEGDNQYDAEWLRRVLEVADTEDPQELAEHLLDRVIGITGGRVKDDITVMVTKLVG